MYLVDERRKLILEDLMSAGTVYVSDLARKYEVTYETIRKDLTHLEQKGLLIKSHGGATLKQRAIEHPFQVGKKRITLIRRRLLVKRLILFRLIVR